MQVEPTTTAAEVNTAPPRSKPNAGVVPQTKGHRPWKKPKERSGRSIRRVATLKLSLEDKQRRREKQEALKRVVQAAREADATARESERKRRAERRKYKQEMELRGTQPAVFADRKKLANMSKKQYLNFVKRNKVLN